ncbi:adenylate kinase, putative [Leishmania tarentolae]|uniref:Adenylate kinase, putative n=1 Tax=Leishmania tarentolae TaxID=5689 RepID=A0A640KH49_LEITA|nr:adenylate kinase, putative [Leishmania tarentolae]
MCTCPQGNTAPRKSLFVPLDKRLWRSVAPPSTTTVTSLLARTRAHSSRSPCLACPLFVGRFEGRRTRAVSNYCTMTTQLQQPNSPVLADAATTADASASATATCDVTATSDPFADNTALSSLPKIPAPFMSSNDGLSEDTITYIKDNNIGHLMEYILRSIVTDKPAKPLQYVHELTASPLPPRVALAGPPASGKGTQARHICSYYKRAIGKKPVHVSSGDLLRAEVAEGTHLGKIAEDFMQRGELVPDSLIISMIRNRLTQEDAVINGWLLDGFPRNRSQAIALDAAGLCPRVFVVLDTPDDILFERVEGRRTDPVTGIIYHLKYNPPPEDDVTLLERLQHRDDDTREVLGPRLKTYHSMVEGLLDYYGSIMYHVDGDRPEAPITKDITEYLKSHDVQ